MFHDIFFFPKRSNDFWYLLWKKIFFFNVLKIFQGLIIQFDLDPLMCFVLNFISCLLGAHFSISGKE